MQLRHLITTFIILVLLACNSANNPGESMLSWFNQFFKTEGLGKHYIIDEFQQPAFIEADLNRDGSADIAVLISEKTTKKKGILVVHGNTNAFYVLGAGKKFGSGDDDFKWLDKWSLYTDKIAFETMFDEESGDILEGKEVKLEGPGLLTEDYEDGAALAGGIIYWNGKNYIWIHQGE